MPVTLGRAIAATLLGQVGAAMLMRSRAAAAPASADRTIASAGYPKSFGWTSMRMMSAAPITSAATPCRWHPGAGGSRHVRPTQE
jgi:hypothetical protein